METKKAMKGRSKSPTKRVSWFGGCGRSALETATVDGPTAMSSTAFAQRVRRALRRRPDDYRELATIIGDLHRSRTAGGGTPDDETETVISQIERAVSLLQCRPQLIAGLRMFLPPQYSIDVQNDAIVVKVYETQGNCRMPDTGHCIPVDKTPVSVSSLQSVSGSLSQPSASRGRPRTGSGRSRSCPGRRSTVERQGSRPQSSASASHVARDRSGRGSLPLQDADASGTVGYIMDVKQALTSQPKTYRRFAAILHRYHDRRREDSTNDELGPADVDAIRQIVSLLRARPQLVLRFNDFLPDGCRIRMFDKSGYVIEYPDAVNGIARLTVAV